MAGILIHVGAMAGLGRDVTFATEPTVLEDVPTVSHLACGAYHTIVLDGHPNMPLFFFFLGPQYPLNKNL